MASEVTFQIQVWTSLLRLLSHRLEWWCDVPEKMEGPRSVRGVVKKFWVGAETCLLATLVLRNNEAFPSGRTRSGDSQPSLPPTSQVPIDPSLSSI